MLWKKQLEQWERITIRELWKDGSLNISLLLLCWTQAAAEASCAAGVLKERACAGIFSSWAKDEAGTSGGEAWREALVNVVDSGKTLAWGEWMRKACPQMGPCQVYQSPQALSSFPMKTGFFKWRNKKANTVKEMIVTDHVTRI